MRVLSQNWHENLRIISPEDVPDDKLEFLEFNWFARAFQLGQKLIPFASVPQSKR